MDSFKENHLAFYISVKSHRGQTRRDGVTPYFVHVKKVLDFVRLNNKEQDIISETVALLHDVVEDTKTTFDDLRNMGISEIVIEAVDALTHRKGESYEDAILRAKANPIARKVKIADNLANLTDTPTQKQIFKYTKSLQVLLAE